jgi:hypothetical protein
MHGAAIFFNDLTVVGGDVIAGYGAEHGHLVF